MPETTRDWNPLRTVQSWFAGNPHHRAEGVTSSASQPIRRFEGPTLTAKHLTRSFGSGDNKTFALKDAGINLYPGELSLLMGPSGSGKSTLLAVISALLHPDEGTVIAQGQAIWELSEDELERFRLEHCSYIFQGYNLFPALSARQQLEVVLKWGELASNSEARKRADHVLGQLGLAKKAHLRPSEMSGGEKQRVAIARALVKNPTFIFADEPTSALDWENGKQVVQLLQACARERNATVLVVTHDHRLMPFADRVFEMADGRMEKETVRSETDDFSFDMTQMELDVPKSDPRLCLRDPSLPNNSRS